VERRLAWRDRQIDLDGETLGSAVGEFNRYNSRKLVIVDPRLANERLFGVYQIDDPEAFGLAVHDSLKTPVTLSDPTEIRLGAGSESWSTRLIAPTRIFGGATRGSLWPMMTIGITVPIVAGPYPRRWRACGGGAFPAAKARRLTSSAFGLTVPKSRIRIHGIVRQTMEASQVNCAYGNMAIIPLPSELKFKRILVAHMQPPGQAALII
jgi:hypothetical protein